MSENTIQLRSMSGAVDEGSAAQSSSSQRSAPSTQAGTRSRISHACDRCRLLRSKCTGGVQCQQCQKDSAHCIYSDRKRERNKQFNATTDHQIQKFLDERTRLITALSRVRRSPTFNPERHPDVVALLQKASENSQIDPSQSGMLRESTQHWSYGSNDQLYRPSLSTGERRALSDVGSPYQRGELLKTAHLNEGSGLVGHIGKLSPLAWLRRIHEYVSEPLPSASTRAPQSPQQPILETASDLSYFTDEDDLLSVNEDHIDAVQRPSWNTATLLSEAFFHAINGAFYFLERETFLTELAAIYNGETPSWPQRSFLGICNMVWAIAARWMQLTELAKRIDVETHLIYYARARAMGFDHRVPFDHPDVSQIQGMGLIAFYLFINSSIHRAWSFLGLTIRFATALGLHLKISAGVIPDHENERRMKIFNSLYRLELLLGAVTGRPPCLNAANVTVSPEVFLQQQPEPEPGISGPDMPATWVYVRRGWQDFLGPNRLTAMGLSGGIVPWSSYTTVGLKPSQIHFVAVMRLCHLNDEISTKLFSVNTTQTWFDIQSTIRDIEGKINLWLGGLPKQLRLDYQELVDFDPRSRLDIATYHCSLKMMLYRPCLCNIEIEDESNESKEFNHTCARLCVEAAVQLVNILPDKITGAEIVQIFPWWALQHYLFQAGTTMLLEMCLEMKHVADEIQVVVLALRKVLMLLGNLSEISKSAYKAYYILNELFEKAVQRYNSTTRFQI